MVENDKKNGIKLCLAGTNITELSLYFTRTYMRI